MSKTKKEVPVQEPAPSRGQAVADNVAALLRARNSLLWVVTREEARVERYLVEAANAAGYGPWTWDCQQGAQSYDGAKKAPNTNGCDDAFTEIKKLAEGSGTAERRVWVMRDLPPWLEGTIGIASMRHLRNVVRYIPGVARDRAQAIIILTPSDKVPPELAGDATVIDFPLPDRAEISDILDDTLEVLPEEDKDGKPLRAKAVTKASRDAVIEGAVGLTCNEVQAAYAKSLVNSRTIEPASIVADKKLVLARERVLEWYDPIPGGLDAVGGLENLKEWLVARACAFTPEARDYGLPAPKGALLVGVSGCGKSLTAKSIATAWNCPLLRLDLGALKGKFVGESEGNLRKALRVIETVDRCIVWLDEIEKAMAGATQGAADGGVSSDALGTILQWMQERKGQAFVFATANDVSGLPPELLRKGRFDELWFVDLPNAMEREAVLRAALKARGRDPSKIDLAAVAGACKEFTGAEIDAIVPEAMFAAFADGARPITTRDLIEAAAHVVPLSETAKDKIIKLREWAKGKARPATKEVEEAPVKRTPRREARVVDVE